MEEEWADIERPPGHHELNMLASRFRNAGIQRLTRDCLSNWVCPICRTLYAPSRNLLIDLPRYGCDRCGVKNESEYEWTITKTVVNHVPLDFIVYSQGPTRDCTLYAVTAAFHCARRIRGSLYGIIESGLLDIAEMREMYEGFIGTRLGFESPDLAYQGCDNLPLVLRVFMHVGISYYCGARFDPHVCEPRLKISRFFEVDKKDVHLITRLIANGYPLVTSVYVGNLYYLTDRGQVYCSPSSHDTATDSHSLCLHGSGMAPNDKKGGRIETYYLARDSHGDDAHPDYYKQKFGGDVLVWSSDVFNVFGFRLYPF